MLSRRRDAEYRHGDMTGGTRFTALPGTVDMGGLWMECRYLESYGYTTIVELSLPTRGDKLRASMN